MAGDNHLTSFEVEGFRAIRRLHLPELAQVNVFVGENNAGKTSLLEALRMYVSRTPAAELFSIIREHAAPVRVTARWLHLPPWLTLRN